MFPVQKEKTRSPVELAIRRECLSNVHAVEKDSTVYSNCAPRRTTKARAHVFRFFITWTKHTPPPGAKPKQQQSLSGRAGQFLHAAERLRRERALLTKLGWPWAPTTYTRQ